MNDNGELGDLSFPTITYTNNSLKLCKLLEDGETRSEVYVSDKLGCSMRKTFHLIAQNKIRDMVECPNKGHVKMTDDWLARDRITNLSLLLIDSSIDQRSQKHQQLALPSSQHAIPIQPTAFFSSSFRENDVVLYPGPGMRKHPGNARLRKLVEDHYPIYSTYDWSNKEKIELTNAIVRKVASWGGRFLSWDEELDVWVEVESIKAHRRVSQMFHDITRKAKANGIGSTASIESIVPTVPTASIEPTVLTNALCVIWHHHSQAYERSLCNLASSFSTESIEDVEINPESGVDVPAVEINPESGVDVPAVEINPESGVDVPAVEINPESGVDVPAVGINPESGVDVPEPPASTVPVEAYERYLQNLASSFSTESIEPLA